MWVDPDFRGAGVGSGPWSMPWLPGRAGVNAAWSFTSYPTTTWPGRLMSGQASSDRSPSPSLSTTMSLRSNGSACCDPDRLGAFRLIWRSKVRGIAMSGNQREGPGRRDWRKRTATFALRPCRSRREPSSPPWQQEVASWTNRGGANASAGHGDSLPSAMEAVLGVVSVGHIDEAYARDRRGQVRSVGHARAREVQVSPGRSRRGLSESCRMDAASHLSLHRSGTDNGRAVAFKSSLAEHLSSTRQGVRVTGREDGAEGDGRSSAPGRGPRVGAQLEVPR